MLRNPPAGVAGGFQIDKKTLIIKDFKRNKLLYLMVVPMIVYLLVFCYYPMYGAVIAFKTYVPARGILGSPWAGLKHFKDFFGSFYFGRLLKNTFLISFWSIVFGFPAPILLALMLNEVKAKTFKKVCQTISYLPYFISMVVVCGLVRDFCSEDGMIGQLAAMLGGRPGNLLARAENFRAIYIGSGIWQGVGWGSIIYLAAIAGIDLELYDAATIDGAGRFRQIIHITIPCILPTIIIIFLLNIGGILNVGFEKIILLYNSGIYTTADVISSFTYRRGLLENNFSYSTAVGLFNSVVNFIFMVSANAVSRKVSETSLW
jgi:putative aldouronate transport system permease protein